MLHLTVWRSILLEQSMVTILQRLRDCSRVEARLYCGFEDAIEVFDLHVPGVGTRLHTTPNRKSRDGLKGKLACLRVFLRLTHCRHNIIPRILVGCFVRRLRCRNIQRSRPFLVQRRSLF